MHQEGRGLGLVALATVVGPAGAAGAQVTVDMGVGRATLAAPWLGVAAEDPVAPPTSIRRPSQNRNRDASWEAVVG